MIISEFESELPRIKEFFKDNIELFSKPNNIRNWKSTHTDNVSVLNSHKMPISPWYGKCFAVAHFLLFFASGRDNILRVMIKKPALPYCTLPDGNVLKTTHWWVEDKETGKVYDITSEQFMYDVPASEFYKDGVIGWLGRPYFGNMSKKSKRYDELVPAREIIRFAKKYKELYGSAKGLDIWIERYDEHINSWK